MHSTLLGPRRTRARAYAYARSAVDKLAVEKSTLFRKGMTVEKDDALFDAIKANLPLAVPPVLDFSPRITCRTTAIRLDRELQPYGKFTKVKARQEVAKIKKSCYF